MPAARDHDLFQQTTEEPLQKWTVLAQELLQAKFSSLNVWKEQYSRWRNLYSRFRELEQSTLYEAGENGLPIKPSEETLRSHRQVIALLLRTGDACLTALPGLRLEDGEADERHNLRVRIETLLAGLRESLELWQPASEEKLKPVRNLFS